MTPSRPAQATSGPSGLGTSAAALARAWRARLGAAPKRRSKASRNPELEAKPRVERQALDLGALGEALEGAPQARAALVGLEGHAEAPRK